MRRWASYPRNHCGQSEWASPEVFSPRMTLQTHGRFERRSRPNLAFAPIPALTHLFRPQLLVLFAGEYCCLVLGLILRSLASIERDLRGLFGRPLVVGMDLFRSPSYGPLRAVLCVVLISVIVSQAVAVDWGLNGTLAVTNMTAFPLTTALEAATYVKVSKPLRSNNLWVASYYVPGNLAAPYHLKLWQIVLGDKRASFRTFPSLSLPLLPAFIFPPFKC